VFIATGLDLGVRQNFMKWATDWNRKDGRKYGALEVVQEAEAADVLLVRIANREDATSETDTRIDAALLPTSEGLKLAPFARRYTRAVVPVSAYILTRAEPGSLRIVWRYIGTTTLEESNTSGQQLWDDFATLLKKRGTTEKVVR
jgi:hypothetical protein